MKKYDDIIHLPHHISPRHPPMPPEARAAQFAPFAALSGHEDNIREAGRQTDDWVELGEDAGEELDAKLSKLRDMVHPNVRIIYFAPDKRKEGGAYRVEEGEIKRIDDIFGEIEFTNGAKIPIKRIIDVET